MNVQLILVINNVTRQSSVYLVRRTHKILDGIPPKFLVIMWPQPIWEFNYQKSLLEINPKIVWQKPCARQRWNNLTNVIQLLSGRAGNSESGQEAHVLTQPFLRMCSFTRRRAANCSLRRTVRRVGSKVSLKPCGSEGKAYMLEIHRSEFKTYLSSLPVVPYWGQFPNVSEKEESDK